MKNSCDLGAEVHFADVTWADDNSFAVTWMNRVQNKTIVTLCTHGSPCNRKGDQIFVYAQQGGWIDFKYRIKFNPNPPNPTTHDFVTILPAPFIRHHYRQLVYVAKDERTYLTKAEITVVEVLAWKDDYIFFVSTLPDQPGARHLFRILSPTAKASNSNPECLTCQNADPKMSYLNRKSCNYYSATMSLNASYFAMICHGPDVPWACIHRSSTGDLVSVFEENQELTNKVKQYDLPTVQTMAVPVSNSDQKAQVKLYFPPNFDRELKYPMVVYAYGGPGFQSVNDQFNQNDFQTYLTSNFGIIYAVVDPKGSGYQGDDWMFQVYRGFGTAEVESLLEVTKYLQALPYVDPGFTATWGWSYGGYLSLSALAHDQEGVFRCGASVAPVTDWRMYDTYYTERYMGLLEENEAGYNRSSVFPYLDNLRGKKYFVLHGTRDDNVHVQQSMLLSAALERRDILFRQQVYPDQDHGIFKYHMHLYHSLTDFFTNTCFAGLL